MRSPDTIRLIAGLSGMTFLSLMTLETVSIYGIPDTWSVALPFVAAVFICSAGAVLVRNYRIKPESSP